MVEEEEGAESEQEGVAEASAEERAASWGVHVSHDRVRGRRWWFWRGYLSICEGGREIVHIPEMGFMYGQGKQGSGRGDDLRHGEHLIFQVGQSTSALVWHFDL